MTYHNIQVYKVKKEIRTFKIRLGTPVGWGYLYNVIDFFFLQNGGIATDIPQEMGYRLVPMSRIYRLFFLTKRLPSGAGRHIRAFESFRFLGRGHAYETD